jgi:hypothetical protein
MRYFFFGGGASVDRRQPFQLLDPVEDNDERSAHGSLVRDSALFDHQESLTVGRYVIVVEAAATVSAAFEKFLSDSPRSTSCHAR